MTCYGAQTNVHSYSGNVDVHFEEAEEKGETSETESEGSTGSRSDCHKEHSENLTKEIIGAPVLSVDHQVLVKLTVGKRCSVDTATSATTSVGATPPAALTTAL